MKKRYYLLVLVILVLLLFIANVPVIFQEGNPLPILLGIIMVEFTRDDIVAVSDTKLLQKAGPENPLSELLAINHWAYKDRLGSGIFYSRDSEELFVYARMYTGRYIVYELDRPFY